eukprot:m.70162 g.70162  ORF g.70162 m.70162 type:complete len:850 (+) comp8628_c0_seq1:102-2651(+)
MPRWTWIAFPLLVLLASPPPYVLGGHIVSDKHMKFTSEPASGTQYTRGKRSVQYHARRAGMQMPRTATATAVALGNDATATHSRPSHAQQQPDLADMPGDAHSHRHPLDTDTQAFNNPQQGPVQVSRRVQRRGLETAAGMADPPTDGTTAEQGIAASPGAADPTVVDHSVDPNDIEFTPSAKLDILEDKPQRLADRIKGEEAGPSLVKFFNRRTNFRTKRVIMAITEARNEVLMRLREESELLEDKNLTEAELMARRQDITLTMKEVNSTFSNWMTSTGQLQKVLERKHTNTYDGNITHQLRREEERLKHIEQLQLEAIREEEELKKMAENAKILEKISEVEKEKEKGSSHSNAVEKVLETVGEKADNLKRDIEEHAFQKAQFEKTAKLLTVVKITADESIHKGAGGSDGAGGKTAPAGRVKTHEGGEMIYLVDGSNNKYALIRPRDTTIMPDDLLLIHDVIIILVCCFFMGLVCSACGLPPLIGHILAGMILGPAGLNMISSLVQVSSIGELGVYFVLFTLGLEFEFEKLQEMWRVAVLCGSAMLVVTICSGVTVGLFLQRGMAESLFVSTCVALSSTAIVAKSITPAEAETTSGRSLIGILLIQDVYLGAIVATTSLVSSSGTVTFLVGLALVAKLVVSIGLVVLFAALTSKLLGRLLVIIHGYDSSVRILALLTICFAFMALTNSLGVSNELGCFIGGVTISATLSTREATQKDGVTSQMHSVLDFFLAIFFANVGTHLYPSFLHQNAWLLLTLAVATMFLKYAVGFSVWLLIWRSQDVGSGHMISAGLCQISEFTFVLATRGTRMEIITQPVYFLLISVAGISLLLSPLVWILARRTARFLPKIA